MTKKNQLQWTWGVLIYALTTLFLIYEMALQVSPSIMTHQLMLSFKIDAKQLGIMASFYFYSYTAMQIPAGALFDRYGPRLLISLSALICAAGSLFFGLTDSVYSASAGRFLMGVGSAFAFVGVLVVATRWFPPRHFAFLVGIAQLLAAFGALGGELPLAVLVNSFGWRTVMIFSGFLGILISLFCVMIIRNQPPFEIQMEEPPRHLMQDLKAIFRSAQTWWIALYALSGWGPVTVFTALWGVPFLMEKYNISNTRAAFACAMSWIGLGLMSPMLGWLSERLGRRRILLLCCSILGFVSSLVAIYMPNIPFWATCIALFAMGLATAGQILTFALVKDNNHHSVIATAIGLNNMAVVIGGALFQPLVGYVLDLYWDGRMQHNIPIYPLEHYHAGLIIVPLCFLIGILVSTFFIRETYCRSRYADYTNYVH